MDNTTVIARAAGQVSCPLGDETAILALPASSYYGLNPVGSAIWNLIEAPRPLAEIRNRLLAEYDVPAETCDRDLARFLSDLEQAGLVEIRPCAA